MSGTKFRDHTDPLFKNLKILPLDKIILNAQALFMHSVFYEYVPNCFENIWSKVTSRNLSQNLRNENDFSLPFPRVECYKKLPMYSLPYIWNSLGDIRYQTNRFTSKTALFNALLCNEI